MRRFLVFLQSILLACPAHGSLVPRERPIRVGVLRYSDGEAGVPSAPKWENRLGRWLENWDLLEVQAENLPPAPLNLPTSAETCRPLQVALSRCQTAFFERKGPEGLKTECQALDTPLKAAAASGICGAELQRGWVYRGLVAGANGKRAEEQAELKRAVLWHPQGLLVSPFDGDREPEGFDAAHFWGRVKRIKEGVVRDCRVDIKSGEGFDSLEINGFPQETTAFVQVPRGSRWAVQGVKQGKGYRSWAQCSLGNQFRTEVDLVRENSDWALKTHLAAVAEARSLDSLLVVRPVREHIHLYLFHASSLRLSPVPTDKPILKSDWESERSDLQVPVVRERLASLLTANVGELGNISDSVGGPAALMAGVETEPKWYNKATFWWVTAGLAVGIASVILITQNGQVRPNPAVRISLP